MAETAEVGRGGEGTVETRVGTKRHKKKTERLTQRRGQRQMQLQTQRRGNSCCTEDGGDITNQTLEKGYKYCST